MRERVLGARQKQSERFKGDGTQLNAQMSSSDLREHCRLDPECRRLLATTIERFGLSVRAHDKILKVARTIADLENQDVLKCDHIREATHYRMLDRPL